MTLTIQLEGGDALREQLLGLGRKVSGPIIRNALAAAAKPIQAAARAAAPRDTGLLASSIHVNLKSDGNGRYAALVTNFMTRNFAAKKRRGVKAGSGRWYTFYGAFIEFGHHTGRRSGGHYTRYKDSWLNTNFPGRSWAGAKALYEKQGWALPANLRSDRHATEYVDRRRNSNAAGVAVAAKPFMRPAFDSQVEAVADKIEQAILAGIDDALTGGGT